MTRRRSNPLLFTDDSPDEPIELPYKFEICGQCEGHGRSSLYLGAFTADEMAEQGPDFHDAYMAGKYDRTCETCDGDGKVREPDYSRMTAAQAEAYRAQCKADDEIDAEHEAERRMGC